MPYPAALGQRPLETHEAYAALEQYVADYGRDPLLLLMHAAVPETLRPDLLNLIRVNFLATHGPDPSLEADVLFSPLATALGGGYYRIDAQVRWHCLVMLRSLYRHDPRPRIRRIAELLWRYVEAREHQASRAADPQLAEFLDIQRWVALAFLEPASAAHAFADALRQTHADGSTVALRLGGLAAAIELPLAGQPELLAYARGLDALASGNDAEAERLLGALGNDEIRVGDIVLKAPEAVLADYRAGAPQPDPAAAPPRRRCLAIQAAGRRIDRATGRELDMDAAYQAIREPLAAAGIDCLRADLPGGFPESWQGLIRDILSVDLVICDLSAQDPATLYLTGISLALRRGNVFVVADRQFPGQALPAWLPVRLTYPDPARGTADDPGYEAREVLAAKIQLFVVDPLQAGDSAANPVFTVLTRAPSGLDAPPTLQPADAPEAPPPTGDLANTCHVIQGFARQTDFLTGRSLDLDKSFAVIEHAVKASGLDCVWFDDAPAELPEQALDLLLRAPLAIVDLSAGLPDIFIQLGLRHGLRPGSTLLLAEAGYRTPPELSPLRILRYKHGGNEMDSAEAQRLQSEITRWLKEAMANPAVDSPVYAALPNLRPPVRRPPTPEPEPLAQDPVPPQSRPRVFISYVHEYRQYAAPLARVLRAEGIDVAWDMDLMAGDAWQEKLTAMLDEADALVAVAGKLTDGRPNPLAEIERAKQQGKRIFPVFVDPLGPSYEPTFPASIQAANIDDMGNILWLSRATEEYLRSAVIARSARQIARALSTNTRSPSTTTDLHKLRSQFVQQVKNLVLDRLTPLWGRRLIAENAFHLDDFSVGMHQTLSLFESLLLDCTRILGPDHPETLGVRRHVAECKARLGNTTQALALFTALLPDCQRLLGPNHPETLSVRTHITALSA
ncbi:TIR domain-containing protein [Zoogloea sp.]|uniref:toll/interleukin-1 receptor domain-containing protein n=1 Tax=Zoogloea sp. TaxID=49181 RepID=UPI0035AFBE6A